MGSIGAKRREGKYGWTEGRVTARAAKWMNASILARVETVQAVRVYCRKMKERTKYPSERGMQ